MRGHGDNHRSGEYKPRDDQPDHVTGMPIAGGRQKPPPVLRGNRGWSDVGFGQVCHDFPCGPTARMTCNEPVGEGADLSGDPVHMTVACGWTTAPWHKAAFFNSRAYQRSVSATGERPADSCAVLVWPQPNS